MLSAFIPVVTRLLFVTTPGERTCKEFLVMPAEPDAINVRIVTHYLLTNAFDPVKNVIVKKSYEKKLRIRSF